MSEQQPPITPEKRAAIERRAAEILIRLNVSVHLTLPAGHVVGIVGALQLALRHPDFRGTPAGGLAESFARTICHELDPEHGDLYTFLMMGFDEEYDRPMTS